MSGVIEHYRDAFRLAVLNDITDLTPIGTLPIIGDVLDAITLALGAHLAPEYAKRKEFMIQLVEFLPFADLMPIHSIAVLMAYSGERDITPIEALRELMEIEELTPEIFTKKFKQLLV